MANYQLSDVMEYRARSHINIRFPKVRSIGNSSSPGRHLRVVDPPPPEVGGEKWHRLVVQGDTMAVMVRLCEDDYPGWLDIRDVELLAVAETVYYPLVLSQPKSRKNYHL